ncbi:MAG: SAM-dependent methyltransferase [Chitinophagales bacterium]
MEKSTLHTHYQDIAANYSSLWSFDKDAPHEAWKLEQVIKKFQLQPADKVCDLGGGPGNFAMQIHQKAQLSNSVLVVDICKQFVEQAAQLPNVESLHTDAFSFARTPNETLFDKILIKEMIHHLDEERLHLFFKNIRQLLSPNGQLLILTRPQKVPHFPFFEAARKEWEKHQRPASFYIEKLQKGGFTKVSSEVETFSIKLLSKTWFQLIRHRFWSNLSTFSDEEIETGILEIKENMTGKHFDFIDKCVFISALK